MITSIPLAKIPFFSPLIKDYFEKNEEARILYKFPPTIIGLKEALLSKEKNYQERTRFIQILDKNYATVHDYTERELENIAILKDNGFAVTTAHQPCLFGGPLYTITKAISIISLARQLNTELGESNIVPIYVIGSEDHDKEELLHTYLFGKKYQWITEQKGSVGSMRVDENLMQVLTEFTESFGYSQYADELRTIFNHSYSLGDTISMCTKNLLRSLFSTEGLIILDMNYPEVKEAMIPVFKKELEEKFSYNTLQKNLTYLSQRYSVQAPPREINLFEFSQSDRLRIEEVDSTMITRLEDSPSLFSPNVILRPLMQQTVIPSIANIGGGAEVAYWLELKPIFDAVNVDFPVILLRDILCPLDIKSWERWNNLGLETSDFFLSDEELKRKIALKNSTLEKDIQDLEKKLFEQFSLFSNILLPIDKSLLGTFEAEKVKLRKSIELLSQKAVKAEKKKAEDLIQGAINIKNKVFSNQVLQERVENFSGYYLKYGNAWIAKMIQASSPLKNELEILLM